MTSVFGVSVLRMNYTKEWAVSLYLPFKTFTGCFHTVSYVLINVGVYLIISVWLCLCIYCMIWVFFIIRMFYWDVFYCAWQGTMEEQSCAECFFFTLYKYIWNKKNRNMCRPGHGSANLRYHYCDVIMGAMVSQTTSLTIVYPIVHSGADQRKYQRSASLAFVWEIHRWPVNSLHKWPVTRKCFHLMTSCEVWIWDFVDNIRYKTGHDNCGLTSEKRNSKLKPKKLR